MLAQHGVVGHRRGEARVGVGGLLGRALLPRTTLPVGELVGDLAVHSLPPHVAVLGHGDVGEDGVLGDGPHRVGIGGEVGPWRDAEVAVLGVHRPEPAVLAHPHPRDVVTDGPDLPPGEALRGNHHREVGLAAGRRERAGHVGHVTVGALDTEDEHVLGEPALVLPKPAADAERQALLAEEGVAAVAGAEAPDGVVFGEVTDVAALGIDVAGAVQAAIEVVGVAERVQRCLPHASHDPHVEDHVDAVGDLDAHLGQRRADRPHDVRDDVHGPALHRAQEQLGQLPVGLLGSHPVVGRAGGVLRLGADEGEVLDPRDVVGIGPVQVAAGSLLGVERDEHAGVHRVLGEALLLRLGPIAPHDAVRLAERGAVPHPVEQGLIPCERGRAPVNLARHQFISRTNP